MSYGFLKRWFSGICSRHEARENRLFDDSPGVHGEYAILVAFKQSVEQARNPFPTARSRKMSYWLFKEKVFRLGSRHEIRTGYLHGWALVLALAYLLLAFLNFGPGLGDSLLSLGFMAGVFVHLDTNYPAQLV